MIILKQYFDKYKEVIDGAVDQDVIQSCTEMIHKSTRLTAEEKKELLLQCQSKSKEILRSKITFWMPTQKLKEILKATLLLTVITTCGQGTMIVSFNNHSTDTRINPFNLRNLFSKPISVTKQDSDYELQQELKKLLHENNQVPSEYNQTITDVITTANKDASFDLEYATKKLSSIRIDEVDNIRDANAYYINTCGPLNILGNFIVLDENKTESLTHELDHAITPTIKEKWAEEAITTYCSNLLYQDDQGYFYTMLAVEMMAEIIGPNVILESNNTGSLEPIKNALYEQLQDEEKVKQVLNHIKNTYETKNNTPPDFYITDDRFKNNEDFQSLLKNMNSIFVDINDQLYVYHYVKNPLSYGVPTHFSVFTITEDAHLLLYDTIYENDPAFEIFQNADFTKQSLTRTLDGTYQLENKKAYY